MKFTKHILSVSTLALAVTASQAMAGNTSAATKEPAYNPATVVDVMGTVTGVRQVASGALAGSHVTVKAKNGTFDVYLAPADFLKFLKTNFTTGEQIEVIGSKVKVDNADVILSQQVDDGYATVTLREVDGSAEWQNWGKEIDPALVQ